MEDTRQAMDVPAHVLEYLRQQATLSLATASPSGLPHAATLMYANDDLALYVWTRPDSVTARHIEQNPIVAFTIDTYSPDWSKTKGIQGTGEAHVLLGADDIRRVVRLFGEKFSNVSTERRDNVSFFRIVPSELQFIDNESAAADAGAQAIGLDYHRSMVFNVFRELPSQEFEAVAAKLDTLQVEPGEVIVRQGAPADKFFIIVDGDVEVVREDDGTEQVVATLGRGQFFGEVAILRDIPRTATVRGKTAATLLTMDRDTFRSLVAQSLATTQNLDDVIRERMEQLGGTAGGA